MVWNSGDAYDLLSGDGLNFQVPLRLMEEPTGTGIYCALEFKADIRMIERMNRRFFIIGCFDDANLLYFKTCSKYCGALHLKYLIKTLCYKYLGALHLKPFFE
jgi:hypothetical protein